MIFSKLRVYQRVNWVKPFSSKHPIVHHLEGLLHRGAHAHVAHVQRIAVLRELREHVHHEGLRGDGDLPGRLPFPEEKRWGKLGWFTMDLPCTKGWWWFFGGILGDFHGRMGEWTLGPRTAGLVEITWWSLWFIDVYGKQKNRCNYTKNMVSQGPWGLRKWEKPSSHNMT